MLHGFVQAGVDFQNFAPAAFEIFGLGRSVYAHRPFEFGIAGPHLIFVSALGIPQAVGGDGFLYGFGDAQLGGELVNLGFGQVGDGADVHAAVAVFGEKTDAEVFDFVAGTRYQTAVELAVVIKRNHAQARAGVGEGKLFVGEFGSAGFDGGGEGVEGRGQVDGLAADVRKEPCQVADVFLRSVGLVCLLADGHVQKQDGQAGAGGQRGYDGGVDTAGYSDDEALGAGVEGVVFQPAGDVADNGLGLHGKLLFEAFQTASRMRRPSESHAGYGLKAVNIACFEAV